MINDVFSNIWAGIENAGQFILDPTGIWGLNLLIWIVVYAGGWYAASMGLTMYATKNMTPELDYHCSKQRHLSHFDCSYQHGNECWSPEVIPISEAKVRKMVGQSMGWAVLWPVVFSAVVIFGPIAFLAYLLFEAIIKPGAIGARVVGEGIVDATASVAAMSVDVIVQRADDINKHKALSAAAKDEDRIKAQAEIEARVQEAQAQEEIEDDPDYIKPERYTNQSGSHVVHGEVTRDSAREFGF